MAFVDIAWDLHLLICTFLHPSDILTLRKTCKTIQFVTRQRTIWIDALRRVCSENMLFLPSFPILDMSDVELEQAAIAPRRWNEQATSFAARESTDSEVRLPPTMIRIIDDPLESQHSAHLVLIPGGRYMVQFSEGGLGVWDLGYTSSADCKLIASVRSNGRSVFGDVHATPDGMGLVICSLYLLHDCSFYEIYPQSEMPQLTKIACLDLPPQLSGYLPSCVASGKIIWFHLDIEEDQQTIFRVWDYRLNASVSFKALLDVDKLEDNVEVVATQTAIIILYDEAILIWAFPPLLPQPLDFYDFDLAQFPPTIRVKFPDSLSLDRSLSTWKTMSSWYFDPSKPLYFDKVYSECALLQRFKIIIKPDFSDATLHLINNMDLTTDHFDQETPFQSMFCEDTLVYSWLSDCGICGIYTASTLSDPTLHEELCMTKISLAVDSPRPLSICPASGRLVYLDSPGKIVVLDILPHQRP